MCHILIIEDEPLVALDLQLMLEDAGGTSFDFAASEEEAIRAATLRRPAIITSDVKLLAGTGPAAVATILDRLGAIPVIFITGTPEDCLTCGPPAVLLGKPLDRTAIHRAFHDLGGGRPT